MGKPKITVPQAEIFRAICHGKPFTIEEQIRAGLDVHALYEAVEILRKQLPTLRGSFRINFSNLLQRSETLKEWYEGAPSMPVAESRPIELLYAPSYPNPRGPNAWPSHIGDEFSLYALNKSFRFLAISWPTTLHAPLLHVTHDIEDAISTLSKWVDMYGSAKYSLRRVRIDIMKRIQEMLEKSASIREEEVNKDRQAAVTIGRFTT